MLFVKKNRKTARICAVFQSLFLLSFNNIGQFINKLKHESLDLQCVLIGNTVSIAFYIGIELSYSSDMA